MLEKLYSFSNELMELALAEQPIPADLIRKVLRDATLHMQLQPVLCGSALHGIGVQPLLDAVTYYLPSPLDVPPVEGDDPTKKARRRKHPQAARPTSRSAAWCSRSPPTSTGDLHWVRVYSGVLKAEQPGAQSRQGQEGKRRPALAHPCRPRKKSRSTSVEAGDIVGVIGLRHSITGDTLCDTRIRSCWNDQVPRDGHLDGDRAGDARTERKKLGDTLGNAQAAGPHASAPRKRAKPARR